MSAATLAAPVFVQTHFNWDEETVALSDQATCIANSCESFARTEALAIRKPSARRGRNPVESKSNNRIGGCSHVGAPLVKVLSKYGFSLDDLLVEIERQKKLAS